MSGVRPIAVRTVSLDGKVATLRDLDGYREVSVLFLLDEFPVGSTTMAVQSGSVSSAALVEYATENFAWNLMKNRIRARLEAPIVALPLDVDWSEGHRTQRSEDSKPVSVILCTRDRTADVDRCLSSLLPALGPDDEVVVVDNAPSSSSTADLVSTSFSDPRVKLVTEPAPGLSHARNTGVRESMHEIVAFTDDDVVVHPTWVRAVSEAFDDERVGSLTGLVFPFELETEAQVLFEKRGGFGRGFDEIYYSHENGVESYIGAGNLGTGANMAFRRSVLESVGGFDVDLGAGTPSRGGEDLDMLFRCIHEGTLHRYQPRALLFHRHRREMSELVSQMSANGTGLVAYHQKIAARYDDLADQVSELHRSWFVGGLARPFFSGLRRPSDYPVRVRWAELWGYVRASAKSSEVWR